MWEFLVGWYWISWLMLIVLVLLGIDCVASAARHGWYGNIPPIWLLVLWVPVALPAILTLVVAVLFYIGAVLLILWFCRKVGITAKSE